MTGKLTVRIEEINEDVNNILISIERFEVRVRREYAEDDSIFKSRAYLDGMLDALNALKTYIQESILK